MADPFFPVPVRRVQSIPFVSLGGESKKWASVKRIADLSLPDPVTHVCFSPKSPYEVAIAHGFNVSLMNPHDGHVRKTLTRFRDRAYSPHFKHDGRLLAAGGGDGSTQVFDAANRTVLRTFRGHKGAVRTAKFSIDGLRVLTGSDDSTVRIWDLTTATSLFSLSDANDYIHCQSSSPASQHVWMTGSADRKARLYDLRSQKCIFVLDHDYQVDSVHILPGGARAVTLGGPEIKVWDFFAGGKVTNRLACHAKAVTCGAVDVKGQKFASGGLDGYMKFHDLSTFETKGILSFDAQILSVDVSCDGKRFATGMSSGRVEVRAGRKLNKNPPKSLQLDPFTEREFEGWGRGFLTANDEDSAPYPGTDRYFSRGPNVRPSDKDVLVERITRQKLSEYDKSLKKFHLSEAFDLAVETGRPDVVVSIIDELRFRASLEGALSGRALTDLRPVLGVIRRNIRNPRYTDRLTHLLNVILDMYCGDFGRSKEADAEIRAILKQVKSERHACDALTKMRGTAEAILCAANTTM